MIAQIKHRDFRRLRRLQWQPVVTRNFRSIAKNKSYSNCLSERKDSRRNLNFTKAVENGKDLGVVHSMNRKRFIEITFQGILILILK